MATFYSSTQNGYSLRLDVAQGTQDIANNRSIMHVTMYLQTTSSTIGGAYMSGGLWIGPGSTLVWSPSGQYNYTSNNTLYVLYSSSFWRDHNADGTLAAGATGTFQSVDQGVAWRIPYLSVTGSITFTRIPRGPRVKHAGVWRNTIGYVKQAGTWKIAIPYVKHAGTWKIGGS